MKIIKYNKQFIDNIDIKSVSSALKEGLITNGKFVNRFENRLKKYLKVKNVISCINGTAGLDLAFRSIDLNKDDIIIMPSINFIASYSMAHKTGATIFLTDVDPLTGQMTPQNLIDCIKKNKIKKIKAVVTMYLGGYPENITEFFNLKKKYSFYLIEDACHAFGASYKYKNKKFKIGSCEHSDLAVFSFHPVKTITTGEGGAVATNNFIISKKLRMLKNHNILRKNNYWTYDISSISCNYRLSDINCALGITQLKKINRFIKNRKKIYHYYINKMKNIPDFIQLPKYKNLDNSSYHLFLVNINIKKLKCDKKKLFFYLNKKGIYPQFHYIPIYKFSFYKNKTYKFHGAENYFNNTISIPIYFGLKKNEQDFIIKNMLKFIYRKKN